MKVKKFDQINVIPFIDIMLVLLVIVLTTATFVAQGIIPVDLPKASEQAAQEIKKDDIVITIKKEGEILIGDTLVEKEKLLQMLEGFDSKSSVIINSDKESRFENFVIVLDALKQKGFVNVGVLSSNEK